MNKPMKTISATPHKAIQQQQTESRFRSLQCDSRVKLFWSMCYNWGLGLPLRTPPSGRQLEWLTGRALASALVLASWPLPALRTSSPSGAHATRDMRIGGCERTQVALQGQTYRSPAKRATWDEGMGMQEQGTELRVLTMVSAQRWGQGRGPEVARSVCGERRQSQNPAPTVPPPRVSRKLPAGPG